MKAQSAWINPRQFPPRYGNTICWIEAHCHQTHRFGIREPRNTTNEEKALKWTVVLQLSSEAFKFEGADAERQVRANTPLPVTLNWNPTPKAAGNWKVALKLKDLNGTAGSSSAFVNRKGVDDIVEVNMNGKPLVFRGSDDIPINIEVWTEYGLPEIWVKWIGAAFALLTAFMAATAAFYKALGTLFRRKVHKP